MTKPTDNPADPFKKALAEATKVMADDPEMTVSYSVDPPGMNKDGVRLPQVSRRMTRDEVLLARGTADAFALRKRHHDPKLFAADLPEAGLPRDIFNAVEQARIEAIGSAEMLGVARNLDRMTENRIKGDPIVRARTPDEVPMATASPSGSSSSSWSGTFGASVLGAQGSTG